jgi:toxin YoeB
MSMLYEIDFTPIAIKSISKYKKSNPVQYKKLVKLLNELMEHPRIGTGHPEPLKSGDSLTYSRRISKKDRLIYDIYEEKVTVLVLSIEGHYSDK